MSAALAAVEEGLADLNAVSKRPMHLAMFLYALEHVSRISRLMKQPGGHMLLIGVGGSGRQSLAKLAAFMAGVELFQVRAQTDWHKFHNHQRACAEPLDQPSSASFQCRPRKLQSKRVQQHIPKAGLKKWACSCGTAPCQELCELCPATRVLLCCAATACACRLRSARATAMLTGVRT